MRRTGSDCINCVRLVQNGEMFTLSVQRQEYLMKVIFYGLRCSAVDRTLIRQGSVLGFSANRVWLVSRFYNIIYIFLHYYKARSFSIPTVQSDVVRCPMQLLIRAVVIFFFFSLLQSTSLVNINYQLHEIMCAWCGG